MEIYAGSIHKMKTEHVAPVDYTLLLGAHQVPMNRLLDRQITLRFTGTIACIGCGRRLRKTYAQGYCFPCSQTRAQCDICILRPELCHYDKGTCREPEWGLAHCMQTHIVYLANSSGAKVGITRHTQVPTRWMDQGAVQALPIMRVSSRYQSGLAEVLLKKWVADKTNWRDLLRGDAAAIDLNAKREELLERCRAEIDELTATFGQQQITLLEGETERSFVYPVNRYPEKIVSLDLAKLREIRSRLWGIKGQYLIFEAGVINMRKYQGYHVEVEV